MWCVRHAGVGEVRGRSLEGQGSWGQYAVYGEETGVLCG